MKIISFILLLFCVQSSFASHKKIPNKPFPIVDFYRQLTLKIRSAGEFSIPFPGLQTSVNYEFTLDQPVYPEPKMFDSHMISNDIYFYRSFWDRILFKDGSFLNINGEKLPLTCIFINGQDNRFAEKIQFSPLLPEFILKVYLVANDFSCQGPIKPGWPETGGKEENWDTYLYYEIRDPTIMLPVDAKLRYRWNEYHVVLTNRELQ